MEKYRKKLKNKTILMALGTAALIAVLVLSRQIAPAAGDSHWSEHWKLLIARLCIGFSVLLVGHIAVNLLALKNEKWLKKRYAKQNDERTAQIFSKSYAAAMQTIVYLGLAATVVAGYFNILVSVTIAACFLVACLITVGFEIFYTLKY